MKKTKLKFKKEVKIAFIIIILIIIAIPIIININKSKELKNSLEYKLGETGYTKEEIEILKDNLDNDYLNTLIDNTKNDFLLELLNNPYYIKNNLNRYLEFNQNNLNYSPKNVISLVNTNRDYSYYDHDLEADTSKDYLVLINKYYHFKEDYVPNDLVKISKDYYYGEAKEMRKVAYDAFKKMWMDAKAEDIYLIINTAYRSFEDQKKTYDAIKDKNGTTKADAAAARPGYSEHQTGLALDIFSKDNTSTKTFKESSAYEWLKENAYKYGFIERYKSEYENITGFAEEAWHFRYVGTEAAYTIYTNDITLDEYYAYFVSE